MRLKLTALNSGRAIRVELWRGERLVLAAVASQGDQLLKTIDRILKAGKLDSTDVQDIQVKCEANASPLSGQMAKAARETFCFARLTNRHA